MGMSIDLAMNNLSGILTEATEDDNSVCYVTEDDAETLQVAINTMHKYQKIAEIVDKWNDGIYDDEGLSHTEVMELVSDEVYEDGDDNN